MGFELRLVVFFTNFGLKLGATLLLLRHVCGCCDEWNNQSLDWGM